MSEHPIPDSYWVLIDRLLAGEYPGARSPGEARRKLRRLLDAGVSYFLDLTEDGEYGLEPYASLAKEEATLREEGIVHRRMPIPDQGTPSAEEMRAILDAVDAAVEAGHTVYVHCWGGIGRTGTVVGCYLVRQGRSGAEALQEIERLRAGTPDGWRRSPENAEQERMVLGWASEERDSSG
jgi:protein-tyrosine phosphatase